MCVCVCAGLTTRTHISRGTKRDKLVRFSSTAWEKLACFSFFIVLWSVSVRLCVGLSVCVCLTVCGVCSVCVSVSVIEVSCVCVSVQCVSVCVRGLACVCAIHMCLSVKGLVCVALLLYTRTSTSH